MVNIQLMINDLTHLALQNYMRAKFATVCISCGEKIVPGKEISKNKDDKWVHKHCVEEEEGLP